MENTQVGPFKIGSRLGNNRRQKVFRAKQVEQDIDVALKFIGLPDGAKRQVAIDKIQIEVEHLKKLKHRNLVKVLGAGIEGNQIFFASELIKGESLTKVLARRGKLAADQVVEYGRQVADVLDYLHKEHIIHSKLTPDKILITRDGPIKVTDLRLNRAKKRRWDSSRKRELDIAAYMAPEQFVDGATEKSDIYSLGIILYEMLTGKLPYEPDTMGRMTRKKMSDAAPPISESNMSCPVWLDKIVCQMISPDPRLRPHTAKAVILAMDELRILDETKKSSVSQVSGSFNPLTAGADKSEANRLLGKKETSKLDTPVFQSTVFLVAGLIIVLGILVFAMWPASSMKNLETAQTLMRSEESSDWRKARDYLNQVIAKGPGDECFAQAEDLYYESRRRTLVLQAERGRVMGLQSPASQKLIAAIQSQQAGDFATARTELCSLLDSVDPKGEERHIYIESLSRLENVIDAFDIPTDASELTEIVEAHQNLESESEKMAAIRLLTRIVEFTSSRPELDAISQVAVELKEQYEAENLFGQE